MTSMKAANSTAPVQEVRKPFLTGRCVDERTVKSSLVFFGTMIVIVFVAFIACATSSVGGPILRVIINAAVILMALYIVFNNGTKRGADDVTRGEILWQKKEKGQEITAAEKNLSYHPMKGYVIGLTGMIPLLILTGFLALNTSIQMTESGTLPSWMQSFVRRSDIGSALINYTEPESMTATDFIRAIVRIVIIPFVNMVGTDNKAAIMLLERLSPLLMLLPTAAYGTGYLTGKNIRTQIHTAISVSNQKRLRKEKKRRAARIRQGENRGPEQLN